MVCTETADRRARVAAEHLRIDTCAPGTVFGRRAAHVDLQVAVVVIDDDVRRAADVGGYSPRMMAPAGWWMCGFACRRLGRGARRSGDDPRYVDCTSCFVVVFIIGVGDARFTKWLR